MNVGPAPTVLPPLPDGAGSASLPSGKVGLWVFMAVVGALFGLFTTAYLMRMGLGDWRPLPLIPWQLWFSTALLAVSSIAWQAARRAAVRGRRQDMTLAYVAGCVCSLAFLALQLWAWQAMNALNYSVTGNPANSFFYLITGLHGLHVAGGLVAAASIGIKLGRGGSPAQLSMAIELCEQYWHFLLALWLAMFGLLFFVTPELVQLICNGF